MMTMWVKYFQRRPSFFLNLSESSSAACTSRISSSPAWEPMFYETVSSLTSTTTHLLSLYTRVTIFVKAPTDERILYHRTKQLPFSSEITLNVFTFTILPVALRTFMPPLLPTSKVTASFGSNFSHLFRETYFSDNSFRRSAFSIITTSKPILFVAVAYDWTNGTTVRSTSAIN